MRDRVLVVDDERDCADTLAMLIRAFGCQAKAVYDGAEAIKQAGEFLPDMVLVDIGMPGLNGYDTVAQLRKQRGNEYLIVVAVTGWSREEYKRRAYDCGFDLFITKPMSYETLKDLLALLDPATADNAWRTFDESVFRPPHSVFTPSISASPAGSHRTAG